MVPKRIRIVLEAMVTDQLAERFVTVPLGEKIKTLERLLACYGGLVNEAVIRLISTEELEPTNEEVAD